MTIRRRSNEGTIHPMYYGGRLTGYRGLASYKDPETGKQRRKSVTRKTRSETEKALKILLRTLPQGGGQRGRTALPAALPPPRHPDTLHALLARWLAYKRRDVRPATYRDYVHTLRFVLPVLGERSLSSLTVLDVEQLVQTLHRAHGPKTAGRVLGRLKMVLRQAVLWQLLAVNVAQHVRRPRATTSEMAVWTAAQVKRFLTVAQTHRLSPLFALAVTTGMRKGELLALQWGDVDLQTHELTVRHTLTRNEAGQYVVGPPKTGAGRRKIVLAADIIQALQGHWRAEHRGRRAPKAGDFVFTAASGNHVQPRHLDRTYRALTQEAGLPRIRFHDLRHTSASLLIRRGVPAKVVADRLGHADAGFTLKVYTHVYDDQRAAAALPLDELLGTAAGRSPLTPPATPAEAQQGVDALRALHTALGEFLRHAPEWAKEFALAAFIPSTPIPAVRKRG